MNESIFVPGLKQEFVLMQATLILLLDCNGTSFFALLVQEKKKSVSSVPKPWDINLIFVD